ncbi:MAG: archaeosortase/exosortase family protein [Nitrospira sp.]|nr:archaeosortase/exosortase family protein [Nitrospira sp.]
MKEHPSIKNGVGLGHQAASSVVLPNLRSLSYALPCSHVQRDIFALLAFLGLCASFWVPLLELVAIALGNERFSFVLVIPILTFHLLFLNRKTIVTSRMWSPLIGLLVMASGAVCYWYAEGQDWTQDRLTIDILTFVVMFWGLFLVAFGRESFRDNVFALAMLLFMIPLPSILLDTVVVFLQRNSADTVDVMFSALGIQALRDGFTFELSNFVILIEEECSGIRSFFALIITSLLAGHWFLSSWWTRAALVAVVVPLTIIKNGSRIVGLSLLANTVDPVFIMDSALHRYGGIPLFGISFAMLICITWLLRKLEQRCERDPPNAFFAQA